MQRSDRLCAESAIITGCRLEPNRNPKRAILSAAVVLAALIGIYLLAGYAQPSFLSGFSRSFVFYPVLWLCLALLVAVSSWKGGAGRIFYTRRQLWAALLVGALQISCLVIAGVLTSFGYSAYGHTAYNIVINTWFFASTLVGMEFARSYLLNNLAGSRANLMVIPLTLAWTLMSLPLVRITSGEILSLAFFYGTCLPLIARNLTASFLAITTRGPLASIAYLGVLLAFEWYSPILPDLSWMLNAFVGTLAAVVGLLILQTLQETKVEPSTKAKAKRSSLPGWVLVAVMCVVIVFFAFGMLGVRPMLLGSGSMSPALDVGDIAVVKAASADDINEGDIIQFTRDGSTTIHRVVAVDDSGSRFFITQGDANDGLDASPVSEAQVQGRVVFRIPKVGWVAIWIKGLFT